MKTTQIEEYKNPPNLSKYSRPLDIVFSSFVGLYLIQAAFTSNYSKEQIIELGKAEIVFTNLFAIAVIIVAFGLWLKLLLIATMITSTIYHMHGVGWLQLGDMAEWSKWDVIFSTCIIVAYAMSWLPNIDGCFKKRIPKATDEWWPVRISVKLIINICVTITAGIIIYVTRDDDCFICLDNVKLKWPDFLAILFIIVAVVLAIVTIIIPQKMNNKVEFFVWAGLGVLSGIVAYIWKRLEVEKNEFKNINHSIWHVLIFYSAYCFSRGSDYIMYKIELFEEEDEKEEEDKEQEEEDKEKNEDNINRRKRFITSSFRF